MKFSKFFENFEIFSQFSKDFVQGQNFVILVVLIRFEISRKIDLKNLIPDACMINSLSWNRSNFARALFRAPFASFLPRGRVKICVLTRILVFLRIP